MIGRRGPLPWSEDFVGIAITRSTTGLDVMVFGRFVEADLSALELARDACIRQHGLQRQVRVHEDRLPDGLIWEIDGLAEIVKTFAQTLATALTATLQTRGMRDVDVTIN